MRKIWVLLYVFLFQLFLLQVSSECEGDDIINDKLLTQETK